MLRFIHNWLIGSVWLGLSGLEYSVSKLGKICFAGSRIIDVETCLFARRLENGTYFVIASHGLSLPNSITLPDGLGFKQIEFTEYTQGPYSIGVMHPMPKTLEARYIAGVSKIVPGLGEVDFVALSRLDHGPATLREAEAFMALADVQNMILTLSRDTASRGPDVRVQ